jgi:tetratricopeptide (TPR) repeat protein
MRNKILWVPAFAGMTLIVFCLPMRAESPEDQHISAALVDINRASERGEFDVVQTRRLKLGDYAAGIGRYDIAIRQYELVLATRPSRSERVKYFTQVGKWVAATGDYSRAIRAFDDALHDKPKDWDANLERARALVLSDINSRAVESYARCIQLRPKEAAPYEELAQVYQKQGFLDKALTNYQEALRRQRKPEIYLHMADCYMHQKNIDKATAILSQAKAEVPRADYDVRLGDIYQRVGDWVKAGAAWEEALKMDPRRDDVRLKLALISDQLQRRPKTDRLFNELLASYPESPLVHSLRAYVLWERGERTAAREEALKADTLSPTEFVGHYNKMLLERVRNSL